MSLSQAKPPSALRRQASEESKDSTTWENEDGGAAAERMVRLEATRELKAGSTSLALERVLQGEASRANLLLAGQIIAVHDELLARSQDIRQDVSVNGALTNKKRSRSRGSSFSEQLTKVSSCNSLLEAEEVAEATSRIESKDAIVDLIAGNKRMVMGLTESRQNNDGACVVSFGKAANQLGYPTSDSVNVQASPRRVNFSSDIFFAANQIVSLAASETHSVCVDNMGRVWTWGLGHCGRLGHGDDSTRIVPAVVRELLLGGHRVVRVAAGSDHTLVSTKAGAVFAWGSNKKGQLGLGSGTDKSWRPRRVRFAIGSSLKRNSKPKYVAQLIAAGPAHSIVVDHLGAMTAWGTNDQGQLGVRSFGDSNSCCFEPTAIPMLSRNALSSDGSVNVQDVQGCDGAIFALTSRGHVMQLGWSQGCRKLAIQDREEQDQDQDQDGLEEQWQQHRGSKPLFVTSISCGPNHIAMIGTKGRVYTMHRGNDGRALCPEQVDSLSKSDIVAISCASRHTCAVEKAGNLLFVANSSNGEERPWFGKTVKKVEALKRVSAVVARDSFTIALVTPTVPPFRELDFHEFHKVPPRSSCYPGVDEKEDQQLLKAKIEDKNQACAEQDTSMDSDSDEDACFDDDHVPALRLSGQIVRCGVPSLQSLCQRLLASQVNFWNCLNIWSGAKFLQNAVALEAYCESYVFENLDAVIANNRNVGHKIANLCEGTDSELDLVRDSHGLMRMFPKENDLEKSYERSPLDSPLINPQQATHQQQRWTSPRSRPRSGSSVAATSEELTATLNTMSLPRLRKRLGMLQSQLEALDDKHLQFYAMASPDVTSSGRKKKKLRSLEESIAALREETEQTELVILKRTGSKTLLEKPSPEDPLFCPLCSLRLNDAEGMEGHLNGKKHQKAVAKLRASDSDNEPQSPCTPSKQQQQQQQQQCFNGKPKRGASVSFSFSTPTSSWASPQLNSQEPMGKSLREIQQLQERSSQNQRVRSKSALDVSIETRPRMQGALSSPPLLLPGNAAHAHQKQQQLYLAHSQVKSEAFSKESQSSSTFSLRAFVKRKKQGPSNVPKSADGTAPWALQNSSSPGGPGTMLKAMQEKVDLSRIQKEQQSAKEKGLPNSHPSQSSWGRYQTTADHTLADIQQTQEQESASERLARELAAAEGSLEDQDRLFSNVARNGRSTNSRNRAPKQGKTTRIRADGKSKNGPQAEKSRKQEPSKKKKPSSSSAGRRRHQQRQQQDAEDAQKSRKHADKKASNLRSDAVPWTPAMLCT